MLSRRTLLTSFLLLVIALVAVAVVVGTRGGGSGVTREAFLEQVHTVCIEYGERLDAIEPPTDLTLAVDVHASLAEALPVLQEQERSVRALPAPSSLRIDLDEFYELSGRSLAALRSARDAADRRDLYPMATALWRFEDLRDEAKAVAQRIGFDC